MRSILTAVLITSVLSGCATVKPTGPSQAEILDSWKGHHYSELIQSWGPPTQAFDNGADGAILLYSQIHQVRRPNYGALARAGMQATSGVDLCSQGGCDPASGATVTTEQSYDMLYVNAQGVIVDWKTNRISEAQARAANRRQNLYLYVYAGATLAAIILLGGELGN